MINSPAADDTLLEAQGLGDHDLEEMLGSSLQEDEDRERGQRLGALGSRLTTLFAEQVAAKAFLEERWMKDMAQHNGDYDADVLTRIRAMGGSEVYANFTRVKCNAVEARESEMVIPTADRNWSIEPPPLPDLPPGAVPDPAAEQPSLPQPVAANDPQMQPGAQQPGMAQPGMQQPPEPPAPPSPAQERAAVMAAAKTSCEEMQTVMDDQLSACDFNTVQRQVIHNKVVLGTGVLKGPVLMARAKRRFGKVKRLDEKSGITVEVWEEIVEEDLEPGAVSVSPWDFFPDMAAVSMDDCEFTFERHRYTAQRLEALKKLPGFIHTQIDDAVKAGPVAAMSGMLDQAMLADLRARRASTRYEVLEYHGPVQRDALEACGVKLPEGGPSSLECVVWICNGLVLKATLSMLGPEDKMYDVVPYERDDGCIFGYGLPYRMRHSQSAGNAAWRMILDNARNSVGPQVVYRAGKVQPKDGDYRIAPNKAWEVTDKDAKVSDVFGVFHTQSNFTSMFDILRTVREFGDEETGMPQIAQGQQSPSITKTAEGMSILMNSANVVLRRLVKEYDDWITTRFIRRLYRWNMRYHEREDVKGDYQVKALGSAALLLMEQQSKGLMQVAQLAATNPEFSQRTKWGDLYRSIVKAMRINADSLVMTEKEFEAEMQRRAQAQQGQIPPELQVKMAQVQVAQAKLQLEQQRAQVDAEFKQAEIQLMAQEAAAGDEVERMRIQQAREEAAMRREAALAAAEASVRRDEMSYQVAVLRMVESRQLSLQQAKANYGLKAMDIDSKHQLFNAERQLALTNGQGI